MHVLYVSSFTGFVSLCLCPPVCLSLCFDRSRLFSLGPVLKMDFDQSFESVAAVPGAFFGGL